MSRAANLIPYLSLIERTLPRSALEALTDCAGGLLYGLQKHRRCIVERNLHLLGLGMESERLARETIRNWAVCISDQLRSLWMTKVELLGMVDDEASRNLDAALRNQKGVVLITSHLGNYELAGSWLAALGFPVHAVVEEIPGGHTDAMSRIRKRFGMKVIAESDTRAMMDVLRKGRILVLLADRCFRDGMTADFGLSRRRVPLGPALLSARTGAIIQTGYFVLCGGKKRYRCRINPAMDVPAGGELRLRLRETTTRIVCDLLSAIVQYPSQWFVFQDEWEKNLTSGA